MAVAPSLWWLFVGRVISGITAASISAGYAYVADVTPPEQRAARFGMLGVAFGAGFVLGPALGGLTGSYRSAPAVLDRGGPEPRQRALRLADPAGVAAASRAWPFAWRRANPLGALKLLRSHRELLGLASVNFLDSLAHAVLPDHGRALHALPLRLGRAHGRLRAGGRRHLRDGGAGRR